MPNPPPYVTTVCQRGAHALCATFGLTITPAGPTLTDCRCACHDTRPAPPDTGQPPLEP